MTTHFAPFTVEVPATTANLGPGFDCLGMALELWNQVRVEPSAVPEVRVRGEGSDVLPATPRNLIYRAAANFARRLGVDMPPLRLEACNAIPLARGLGSSAAAVVAGLMIANHVAGDPLARDRLLALAVELEGHPDNAAPALWGGACLVVQGEDGPVVRQLPVAEGLTCVVFIPDTTLSTKAARSILPRRVPRADAVFNLGRAALLVNVLTTGRWEDLRLATEDRLHQPYRAALMPTMEPLSRAALGVGAFGAFLSGAGPSVLAFASPERASAVAAAFEAEAASRGVDGHARVTEG